MPALGWLRRGGAELAGWLLPLVVVAEYVGTTFGNILGATFGLLAIFAAALLLGPPNEPARAWPRSVVIAGRVLGPLLVVGGALGMLQALAPMLDPAHYKLPPLPTQRHREAFLLAAIPFAYVAALGFRVGEGRTTGRHFERLGLLVALVLLAHMVGKQRVQGLPVLPYGRPGLDSLTVTASAVLVLLLFVPKVPPVVRMLALLGAGLGLRWVGLETWKLDPGLRDMLPLVQSAQDAFASGQSPYALHQMQPQSVVPLTYLPGMWLGYGLPRLFGGDLRLMGLVADAAVVGGLFWAASGVSKPLRSRAQGIAIGFGAVWLFSPSLAWNGIYAEPHLWWLVLSVVIAATLRQRYWLAAAALGVAICTRHFALVVAPFVVLSMLRTLGWRATLGRLALTGTIAAAFLVPFVARDPEMFWFGTFRWLVEYGPAHQGWFLERYGFSGLLYKAGATEWMPRAQLALPLVALIVAAFVRGTRRFVAPAGFAYVLFIMFNGIIWDSFYLGASLFAAYAAAGAHALEAPAAARPPSRRALLASAVLFAAAFVAGAFVVFTFARAQSRAGKSELRAALRQKLAPGDALVDRTDYQLAFVKGEPLFDGQPVPVATGRDVFDAAFGPLGALGKPRGFFALRDGRDDRLASELRQAGLVSAERSFGRYRLLESEGLVLGQRLAGLPGAYVPRPCRLGGMVRTMAGAEGPAGKRAHVSFSGVTLGRALLLVGGTDDRLVVWGRKPVTAHLGVNGQKAARLAIPNLPGAHYAIVDTRRFGPGPHQVEVTLTSRGPESHAACIDGFVVR